MQNFYTVCNQIKELVGFEYFDNLSLDLYIADFIKGKEYPKENNDVDPFALVDRSYNWYIINFAGEGDPRVGGYGFYPAFDQIHKYATLHQIPLDRVILFSSNLKENESYNCYCIANRITDRLKIFIWSPLMYRLCVYNHDVRRKNVDNLFLCLNNGVPKNHRSFLTYLLYKYNLINQTFLSTYKIPLEHLKAQPIPKDYIKLLKNLESNFFESEGNCVFSCPRTQVEHSLISIVNETHHDHFDLNMIDITEKVFKPMLWKQPLVIFGAENANTNIQLLGFKSYQPMFNLDFDTIPAWRIRFSSGAKMLFGLQHELKSQKEMDQWLEKGYDIIEHNYNLIKYNIYNKSIMKEFLTYINGPTSWIRTKPPKSTILCANH